MLTTIIVDTYNDVLSKSDPRVENWLFMSSPFPTLLLTCMYVSFVKIIGPKLMEHRKPFQLKNVMIAYNAFQTVFSAWMFYGAGVNGWFTDYNFRCQPVDYSNSPSALGMLHIHWWFFFSKFTEFTDTTQFAIVIVHATQTLFIECEGVPKIFVFVVLFQAFLFYILFMNFYQKSYKPEETEAKKKIPPAKPRVQHTTSVQTSFKEFVLKQLFGMCIPDQSYLHDDPTSMKNHQNGTSGSETLKQS
ncbi:uncharacterized protein CBL_11706 [Carabus blaptoides fortunei]